jgi:NAD(P)H dehydrogenase (quinone)
MPPVNVLIIFSSRTGVTEKLALAAAVGAVQARANIRLRRLPEGVEGSGEDLARMTREYVPPTQADALWADAIIVGLNGKIGGVDNVLDATVYGRGVARSIREKDEH